MLGTAIAVAFARSPMTIATVAHDLQALTSGRFVLGLGSPDRGRPGEHLCRRGRRVTADLFGAHERGAVDQLIDMRVTGPKPYLAVG